MREIRFRAKAINDDFYKGEWVYGYYLKSLCGVELVDVITDGAHEIPIQVDTLGQFTGLKDRDGIEIYEGDIIMQRGYSGMRPCVVKFDAGAFIIGWHGGSSTLTKPMLIQKNGIVMGNIYDNKDLIKK